jgi:hypothetical protein
MKTVLSSQCAVKVNPGKVKTKMERGVRTKLNPSQQITPPSTQGGFDYTMDFGFE